MTSNELIVLIQVLFFVDFESLAPIKEKFAIYADKFDPFAIESNAMSQYLGMCLLGIPSKMNYQY